MEEKTIKGHNTEMGNANGEGINVKALMYIMLITVLLESRLQYGQKCIRVAGF
jgi:hypothetical protein